MPTPAEQLDAEIQTVAFVSLGCPKNLVDSEKMLGLLAEDGLIPVPPEVMDDDAVDAIVINTCGFLEASKDESMGEIERAAQAKREGRVKRLVVAGCLVQRHRAKMLEWCPDIDALIGVFDRDHIVDAVRPPRKLDNRADVAVELPVYSSIAANATLAKQARHIDTPGYFEDDSARLRLTPRHYAYLRISEGCNQNCAFCTIPSIRGKMRSKHPDKIVAELKELLADGAFEINLIGQDTTSYGHDIGYEPGLVGLLETLNATAKSSGGAWLRLMYAYPSCFTDDMIDAIARLPYVSEYIDMPLQHINDRVLDAMRRKTSRKLITTLLGKLRDRVPGMAIRTTFISGFPGETDAEHQELVDFVTDFGFDAMGVFPYSPEPGTPAGTLHRTDAIPDDVIAQRIDDLMLAQQDVAFARNERYVAEKREFDVLIDGEHEVFDHDHQTSDIPHPTSHITHVGRTYQQAPDIDSVTRVVSKQALTPGDLVRCRIVAFDGYDLIASPVEEADGRVSLNVVR